MRSCLSLLLLVCLLLVACEQEAVETTTTTSSTTTTTTTTTTTVPTTTVPLVTVVGAPPELAAVVERFYSYATESEGDPPPAPEPVLETISKAKGTPPRTGAASVGTFHGQAVAAVEMEDDLFLAVDDGHGWRIVGGKWPSLSLPAYYGPSPRLVAVVGSDARPGESVVGSRADSIHFVGLDGAGQGGVVGVPRDSYVPIAGGGRSKINAALPFGGPEAMMQTFRDLTALPIEGYVLTGFAGFVEMAGNVLGGVGVEVPFDINDRAAKANLVAGKQVLDGPDALAFSRARKTMPAGDFTRSAHQGLVLIGAAKMVRRMGYGSIPRLLQFSEPFMETDLTPEQLLTFSALAMSSDLDAMPNVVAPGSPGRAGAASVVFLSGSANALWADLADGRLGN